MKNNPKSQLFRSCDHVNHLNTGLVRYSAYNCTCCFYFRLSAIAKRVTTSFRLEENFAQSMPFHHCTGNVRTKLLRKSINGLYCFERLVVLDLSRVDKNDL